MRGIDLKIDDIWGLDFSMTGTRGDTELILVCPLLEPIIKAINITGKVIKLMIRSQQNGGRKHYLFQGFAAPISLSKPSPLGG